MAMGPDCPCRSYVGLVPADVMLGNPTAGSHRSLDWAGSLEGMIVTAASSTTVATSPQNRCRPAAIALLTCSNLDAAAPASRRRILDQLSVRQLHALTGRRMTRTASDPQALTLSAGRATLIMVYYFGAQLPVGVVVGIGLIIGVGTTTSSQAPPAGQNPVVLAIAHADWNHRGRPGVGVAGQARLPGWLLADRSPCARLVSRHGA